jgi:hypothetical protein
MPRAGRSTGNCWPRSWPCDLSVRDMADVLGRSPTTVRHWLAATACRPGRPGDAPRSPPQTARGSGSSSCRAIVTARRGTSDGRTASAAPGARSGASSHGGGRSSGSWSKRLEEPASSAGMRTALPPCSSITSTRARVVLAEPSGRHTVARQGPGGSREVRTAVRELSRQGRSWARSTSPKIGRSSRLSCLAQEARSGVAQWQSIRLLIEGLWVRVPPPELDRGAAAAGDASMRPVASVSPRAARPSPGASSGR